LPRFGRAFAPFVIAVVLIAAAGPAFIRTWSGQKVPDDFHVVYSGARAILNHEEIYGATNGMYIYSPFLAFVFQPLALFPERFAAIGWFILTAIIILATTLIISCRMTETWHLISRDDSAPCLISAGTLLLSFEKVRSEFILGQTDCLILLGLGLIFFWIGRRPRLAAVTIGATANFKYFALIFVPYFVIKRNYRAAILSTAWFVFFFTLPAVEIGGRLVREYIANAAFVLVKVVGGPDFVHSSLDARPPIVNSIVWTHSVSLTSAVFRVARSLYISGWVAVIVSVLLFVIIVAALHCIGRRNDVALFRPAEAKFDTVAAETDTIELAALIVLALIFGPQTTARHMILLLPVSVVGITLAFVEQRRSSRALLIAPIIATSVALSLPFRETGVHPVLIALKSTSLASWFAVLVMFSIAIIGCRQIGNRFQAAFTSK
jgi:Glycosyltransferase family 87